MNTKKYKTLLCIKTTHTFLSNLNVSLSFNPSYFSISFTNIKKGELKELTLAIKNLFYPFVFANLTININYLMIKKACAELSNDPFVQIELFSFTSDTPVSLEFRIIEKSGIIGYHKLNKEGYLELNKSIAMLKLKETPNLVEKFGKFVEGVSNIKVVSFYYMNQGLGIVKKYFEELQQEFNKNEKHILRYKLKHQSNNLSFNYMDNAISGDTKQFDLCLGVIKLRMEDKLLEYIDLTIKHLNLNLKVHSVNNRKFRDPDVSKTLFEYHKTTDPNGGTIRREEGPRTNKSDLKRGSSLTHKIESVIAEESLKKELNPNFREENQLRQNLSSIQLNVEIFSNLNVENFLETNIKKSLRKNGKLETPKFKLNKKDLSYDGYGNGKINNTINEGGSKDFNQATTDKKAGSESSKNDEMLLKELNEQIEKSKESHLLHAVVDLSSIIENTSEMYARYIFTQIYLLCFKDVFNFELDYQGILKYSSLYQLISSILSLKTILLTTENISTLSSLLFDC